MNLNKKCSCCGSDKNVFFEAVFDKSGSCNMKPICIKCKSKDLEIDDLMQWENSLKKLEMQISKQIIDRKFSSIKFKKSAQKKLVKLMRKYSIRKVFEVCTLLNDNNFSLHKIEMQCNV